MKLIATLSLLIMSFAASAWEMIPAATESFAIHRREALHRGLEFGIKAHTGDSLDCRFVSITDIDDGGDDLFNRHMLKLNFGRIHDGERSIDSVKTLNISGYEKDANGVSLRLRYQNGSGLMEIGASEPVYRLIFSLDGKGCFFEWFSNSTTSPLRDSFRIHAPAPLKFADFESVDSLKDYLNDSEDPYEGFWTYYDHEGSPLQVSANLCYTLACVKTEDGYDLLYLSNDGKEIDGIWQPLAVKACLTESGFDDIYNLQWLTRQGFEVDRRASAQFEGKLLTLRFPYWKAAIRMVKMKKE